MKRFFLFSIFFILFPFHFWGQYERDYNSLDSTYFSNTGEKGQTPSCLRKITDSRLYQISYVPVSLFALSGISSPFEGYVRDVRNSQIPGFHYHYDDYLQFLPGVALLGLKISGVEGRSDWKQMLSSTAASAAIMSVLVNGVKYATQKERPDGSTRNSFPSGHTATAFMTATWLHKEYGKTRSPLYSIAGYSVATITGLSRILNNRHWLSDVLAGAGVGILSAEIGYWIGDRLFQEKQDHSQERLLY